MTNQSSFPSDAWELLSPELTNERRSRMQKIAALRTNHIQVVLQDIHDPHNISACLRSAEAFGVLEAHVVTMRKRYSPSTAARGVHRWLNIHRYNDVNSAVIGLKDQGLLLAAGYPDASAVPLDQVPLDQPIAVIFGNEHEGVHKSWREHIDIPFTIPMSGFVESLNISVSCAISLYSLTQRAQQTIPATSYYLDEQQRQKLLNRWACQQFPESYQMQLKRLRNS